MPVSAQALRVFRLLTCIVLWASMACGPNQVSGQEGDSLVEEATARLERLRAEAEPDPEALRAAVADVKALVKEYAATTAQEQLELAGWLESIGFALRELESPGGSEEGWSYFEGALRIYAGSTLIGEARERYLRLVFELAGDPAAADLDWQFALDPERREWLEDAVGLATSPEERTIAHYLMARFLAARPTSPGVIQQIGEHLQRAAGAESTGIYRTAALFHFAAWNRDYGARRFGEAGRVIFEPDFQRALGFYQRVIDEGPETDSALMERAKAAVAEIRREELELFVSYAFKPDAEPFFHVRHRNLEAPKVSVYPLDLLNELPSDTGANPLEAIVTGERIPVFEAPTTRNPERPHYRVTERVGIPNGLSPGCYLVEAVSGERRARALLFISRLALVVRWSNEGLVSFVCDADTGLPLPEARVRVFAAEPRPGASERFVSEIVAADDQGFARVDTGGYAPGASWFVLAAAGEDEIYAAVADPEGDALSAARALPSALALADRPLVTSGQELGWKVLLRRSGLDAGLTGTLLFRISNSAGGVLAEGETPVGEFQTASGSLRVPAQAEPGPCRIRISTTDGRVILEQKLFDVVREVDSELMLSLRLESSVSGRTRDTYVAGDSIEGRVQLNYETGLPVADARVEVATSARPLRDGRGSGSWRALETRTLRSDSGGVVNFAIEVPQDAAEDSEYRIRARALDTAGNEVFAEELVPVTRQAYFVRLQSAERIFSPEESLRVRVETVDARGRPVSVTGQVRLTREKWRELYVHFRRGNSITGEEYRALPERSLLGSARSDYRLKEQGFVTEEVAVREIESGSDGVAQITLQNPGPGYYRVSWQSSGRWDLPVRAEERIWVAREGDLTLGYRAEGIEMVADLSRAREGEGIPVLVITRSQNQFVVLMREGRRIEVLHAAVVQGNSHLFYIEPPDEDRDLLHLEAFSVLANEFQVDHLSLRLPQSRGALRVSVNTDRRGYEPRSPVRIDLQVLDESGQPVSAEVMLSVRERSPWSREERLDGDWSWPSVQAVEDHSVHPSTLFWRSFDWLSYYDPTRPDAISPVDAITDPQFLLRDAVRVQTMVAAEESAVAGVAEVPAPRAGGDSEIRVRAESPGTTRVHFAPDLRTGEDGRLSVEVRLPNRLGEWTVEAVAVDGQSRIGGAREVINTRLPVVVRMLEPRYLHAGDRVTVPALIANNTIEAVSVEARISASDNLALSGEIHPVLELPGRAERELRWDVEALAPGLGQVWFSGEGSGGSVREEAVLPVHAGASTADAVIKAFLPAETGRRQLSLGGFDPATVAAPVEVMITPGVAPLIVERLRTLLDEDVQQAGTYAISRRLIATVPAVGVLRNLGFSDRDLAGLLEAFHVERGSTEPGFADYEQWVRDHIAELWSLQSEDGSWPWMPGGPGDVRMTAIALRALQLAANRGFTVEEARMAAAREYLEQAVVSGDLRREAMVLVLGSMAVRFRDDSGGRPTRLEARLFDRLIRDRDALPVPLLAMLAIAAADYGFTEDGETLLSVILSRSITSGSGAETRVYWTSGRGGDALESTALVVNALLRISPGHPQIEPALAWLLEAGGSYRGPVRWESIHRLAALIELVRTTGELEAEAEVRVVQGSVELARFRADPATLLRAPYRVAVDPEHLDFSRPLTIERVSGNGAIYTEIFLGEAVGARAGPEGSPGVSVERHFLHLNPTPTLLSGFRENVEEWAEGSAVPREHNLVTVLRVAVDRPSEYVVVRDFCAAGTRVVGIQDRTRVTLREVFRTLNDEGEMIDAGYTGREIAAYLLFDGRRVVLNLRELPPGSWEFRYRSRAEFSGSFLAPAPTLSFLFDPGARAHGVDRNLLIHDE